MKKLVVVLGVILLLGAVTAASLLFVIYREVRVSGKRAVAEYGGSVREALVKVMNSDTHSFSERNTAIWSLGQLADGRSLPDLRKLYTGVIPEREPLDKMISQYELRKAIRWCEKGNKTSWMYIGMREKK